MTYIVTDDVTFAKEVFLLVSGLEALRVTSYCNCLVDWLKVAETRYS